MNVETKRVETIPMPEHVQRIASFSVCRPALVGASASQAGLAGSSQSGHRASQSLNVEDASEQMSGLCARGHS